jgi:hypothetical protein
MKDKQNLDSDILKFFKDIENQNDSDRNQTLRLLMDKYIHLTKSDYIMDKFDFNKIISSAKKLIIDKTLPVKIGKTESKLLETEIPNLCVIESTISFLNNNGCLKKIAKFDYKK